MWPYPKIVAHRGGGKLAPENTLAAMRCGLAHGFRAVEFDVMLSADGVPILMHDPVLGRTLPGLGRVSDYTAAELTAMDAGSWFGAEFIGEPVCTYQQAMAFCRQHGIWMNVEIKPVEGFEVETGHVVAQATQAYFEVEVVAHLAQPSLETARNLPLLSSFSSAALRAAQVAAVGIPRAYLTDVIEDDWQQNLQELAAVALHTNHKYLAPMQAAAIKDAGYGLFCYTVNTVKRAGEILAWGVDGFCTDRIDLIGADFCQ
ncbi:glycerophosphodiester phosphodiesterase [Glaciimonas sp. PCH181]|uniref:glycerophosphodiester phosphodiesterase n=1 Tax=Glaciimonas sp. PCH181 TaxID=2133943 RepID=UPI000D38808F|nr:glycerophosphodiester phosphodiesterase [Glaciimonas sp. PCH181]PUA20185.1 glycerophosphodiester phosphodiesterase [Glaciimonas sp. PCH181]